MELVVTIQNQDVPAPATVTRTPVPRGLSVLVIDDEKNIRSTLSLCLESLGCEVSAVPSGAAAVAVIERQPYDLAFLDLRLGTERGLDLIPRLLAERPDISIVMITAYAAFDTAVEAIRRGAWDYLPKPFTPAQIQQVVDKVVERRRLALRVANLESELESSVPRLEFSTASARMQRVYDTLARAAQVDVPVLIRGETGTGKTAIARFLHTLSPRRDHPFVVVNCPTLSEELLASELFGHARGSFTGAVKEQPGRVETAHGGTLFLDEIGEMPPSLQAKLLRFVQDKQFERIGENRTRLANVRVIAATNRDLEADIVDGRFREDLFYRLSVVDVVMPALRERREDILPLARRFVDFYGRAFGRRSAVLSAEAEAAIEEYHWPGNVRELQNTIERALILWPAPLIEPAAFPKRIQGRLATLTGPQLGEACTLEEIEKQHITLVMAHAKSMEEAAVVLGIDSSTLWRKRKSWTTKAPQPPT
jgi:NtrC-family two-component system response regulator AlgB